MENIEDIWQEEEAKEAQIAEQVRLEDALQMFGVRLISLFDEQVAARSAIEDRWLDDLRAYHGKYDESTTASITGNGGSSIFVNITRHKCNTAEARLIDMLFPADDKNWSISETPIPFSTSEQANPEIKAQIAVLVEQAKDKAKSMERQIDDQLKEADFAAKSRDVIHDSVIFGTGILKAPVVEGRINKRWDVLEDGTSVLQIEESLEPTVEVVSPWDYYPDMSARNKSECAFEFERKHLTKKGVKDLLKLPNILHEQVMRVLTDEEAEITENDRFSEIRQISGDDINVTRERFELLEYHGEITGDELESVGMENDGLGMNGTVLILNGKVIRVSLNPLETEESPYAVFNWEVDANSMFGFGVPYLVRSPQSMINAATRMMMDNAKMSVAPQILMNKKLVRPADGDWKFSPFKRWYVTDDTMPIDKAIQFFNVPSNQADLSAIYQMGRFLIDEQASLPAVATGEGDPNAAPQTATGVAINSGAAKVVFKRVVKNFDDDFTTPIIKRFYDWNMQYSNNAEIKGDMQVVARGSSSLMVREQEAAMMSELLKMVNPQDIMMRIKPEEALKEFFKSRNINSSMVLKSDEEFAQDMQKMQEQSQQQQSPEAQKLQMQMQLEQAKLQQKEMQLQLDAQKFQAEAQQKEQQMMLSYEMEMSKLAAEQQTTVEKLKQQAGAMQFDQMMKQMQEQNKREIADMQLSTQRQIAAIKAQQESNKQAMQSMNLQAGYDTF